jgi:hypothetical protein
VAAVNHRPRLSPEVISLERVPKHPLLAPDCLWFKVDQRRRHLAWQGRQLTVR